MPIRESFFLISTLEDRIRLAFSGKMAKVIFCLVAGLFIEFLPRGRFLAFVPPDYSLTNALSRSSTRHLLGTTMMELKLNPLKRSAEADPIDDSSSSQEVAQPCAKRRLIIKLVHFSTEKNSEQAARTDMYKGLSEEQCRELRSQIWYTVGLSLWSLGLWARSITAFHAHARIYIIYSHFVLHHLF
jgi:hypothetical protein